MFGLVPPYRAYGRIFLRPKAHMLNMPTVFVKSSKIKSNVICIASCNKYKLQNTNKPQFNKL